MQRLLVTGASGFLGWNICRAARGCWDVTGTYCRHPLRGDGIDFVCLDVTGEAAVDRVVRRVRPAAVIHVAADANPNHCETHPETSFALNVEAAAACAARCAAAGIPFVFTSTDLVFDGTRAPYGEDAPPSPRNTYGRQKAEAERRILEAYPGAAVCRMPLMFGSPGPHATSFLQPQLEALTEGRPQSLFVDEFRTPVSAAAAARGLLMVLSRNLSGVLHLGGRERISRYDFGCLLADVYGVAKDSIVPARRKDVAMPAARPRDVSLDSSRAFALGYDPGTLREQLAALRSDPQRAH